jgi:hypothetical protein
MHDDLIEGIKERLRESQRRESPDYSISVYCDRHIGVRMKPAISWGSMEYSDTAADLNRTHEWVCPKPECSRSYEPMMFGYHDRAKPGTRRGLNELRQHRGNHPQLPFMYIGKVGEGRQFLCPLYKCTERGPQVVDSVTEEVIETPVDPLSKLKKDARKSAVEMAIFDAFAAVSGLAIDEESEKNRNPDYPDVECTISGQLHFFELGRIISSEVAEKLDPNRRKPEGGFSFNQEQPLLDIVESKKTKRYTTDGAPVDLILHFDLRLGTATTVERLIQRNPGLLDCLYTGGPFKRVWVFDEHAKRVIYTAPTGLSPGSSTLGAS